MMDPTHPPGPGRHRLRTTDVSRHHIPGRAEAMEDGDVTVVTFHLPLVGLEDLRFRTGPGVLIVWSLKADAPYRCMQPLTNKVDPAMFYVTQNNGVVEFVFAHRAGEKSPSQPFEKVF